MRIVEIPGGTAMFREAADLRGRDSDLIEAASMSAMSAIAKLPDKAIEREDGETDTAYALRAAAQMEGVSLSFEEAQALVMLRRASVIATLAEWDLKDVPLPKTMDALADLPRDLYQALLNAVGGQALESLAPPDFKPQTATDTQPPNIGQEIALATPTDGSTS